MATIRERCAPLTREHEHLFDSPPRILRADIFADDDRPTTQNRGIASVFLTKRAASVRQRTILWVYSLCFEAIENDHVDETQTGLSVETRDSLRGHGKGRDVDSDQAFGLGT